MDFRVRISSWSFELRFRVGCFEMLTSNPAATNRLGFGMLTVWEQPYSYNHIVRKNESLLT